MFYYQFRSRKTDEVLSEYANTCAGGVTGTRFDNKYLLVFVPKKPEVEEFMDEYLDSLKELGFKFEKVSSNHKHTNLKQTKCHVFKIEYSTTHGRKYLATYSALRYLYREKVLNIPRNFVRLRERGMDMIPALYWAHYGADIRFKDKFNLGGYDLFSISFNNNSVYVPTKLKDTPDLNKTSIIRMMVDEYKSIYDKEGSYGNQYILDKDYVEGLHKIHQLNFKGKFEDSVKAINSLKYDPTLKSNKSVYNKLIATIQ